MASKLTIGFVAFVGVCAVLILLYARSIKQSPAHTAYLQGAPLPPVKEGTATSATFACIFGLLMLVPFAYLSIQNVRQWRYVSYPLQQRGIVVEATILDAYPYGRSWDRVDYEFVATSGSQPGVLFQRTEAVEKDVYEEVHTLYVESLKTHRPARLAIRYLPENPTIARIDSTVNPRSPITQVVFILGMMTFGLLMGVVPTQIGVWRWLIPHGYVPWTISSIVIIYASSLGVIFWLSMW
jgi:hypothetical protein